MALCIKKYFLFYVTKSNGARSAFIIIEANVIARAENNNDNKNAILKISNRSIDHQLSKIKIYTILKNPLQYKLNHSLIY